jgi:hypothetical protein
MKESLVLVPEQFLQSLSEKTDEILTLLKKGSKDLENGFITEKQAMSLFKRRSTWFWQMRRCGALPYSKIGKSIYYSLKDIQALLESNKVNSNPINPQN